MRKAFLMLAGGALMATTAFACSSEKGKTNDETAQEVEGVVVEEEGNVIEPAAAAPTMDMPAAKEGMAKWFADPAKSVEKDSTGYVTTPSGLKYLTLREGTGRQPSATNSVMVNYAGYLADGTVFDSSYDRGKPISFPLNQVIPGWTEGLQLMKEGGKTVFYIPWDLAYGERGIPGTIPPKADLIFEVELLSVQ